LPWVLRSKEALCALPMCRANDPRSLSNVNGGDADQASAAVLNVANQFLETDLEKLKAAASMGYARGKLSEVAKTLPRDRKDWYDLSRAN
jgi:hypothetical protein